MPSPTLSRLRVRPVLLAPLVCAWLVCGAVAGIAAQESPLPQDSMAVRGGVSPRGAMLRAMAVPGWGHASIGSYHRGAFYFVAEAASFWMYGKSRLRLFEARRRLQLRESFVRKGATLEGIDDPTEVQALVDADEMVADLRGLENSRRQQREDWAALGIFLVLLSGADAYVSSHLKDFPAPIELSVQPVGGGRLELQASVRLAR